MSNKPFIFSSSKRDHEKLINTLEKAGVELKSVDDKYDHNIWNLSCPWLKEDDIELVWNQVWWPDGEEKEDTGAQIIKNGKITKDINFRAVSNYEEGSLRENIIGIITQEIGSITGRHT